MKKDSFLPPLRIATQERIEFEHALEHFGLDRPEFFRYCMQYLVKQYKARQSHTWSVELQAAIDSFRSWRG